MTKKQLTIFKPNPVKEPLQRILDGNQGAIYRRFILPRTGWQALKLKVFPTSAHEARYPQKVPRVR